MKEVIVRAEIDEEKQENVFVLLVHK